MTGGAADTFGDVYRMIEIRKVGQIMDAYPLQRLAGLKARAHRFEIGAVCPNLFMTIHADGRRRHSGRRRRLDGGVTVTAVDAVVAHMMFVTELNRLLPFDVLPGVPA